MGIEWSSADLILLAGLAIVFLIAVFSIRAVNGRADSAGKPAATPALAVTSAAAAPAPVIEAGIEEETVAAIMAAIYSCLGETEPNVRYAVKSIARAQGARPVWGFAGMQQNTRPF